MYLISDEAVEEEESMIDLAQALYAAGVRPEPLFSISEEENLCREEPEPQIVLSPILSEDTSSASGLHDVDEMDDEDTNKVCTYILLNSDGVGYQKSGSGTKKVVFWGFWRPDYIIIDGFE